MSIYSANRMGRFAEATAVANCNYTDTDIGNILYESQLNDQAFFEAIVLSDLREIKGIQEGTLLESEVEALNEASLKGFFQKLWDRLKAFWEKVKGVFKSVINKIALFVMGDGKKFVKEFDEVTKGLTFTGELTDCRFSSKDMSNFFKYPEVEDIKKKILSKKNETSIDKKAIIAEELGNSLYSYSGGDLTPKEFKEKAKEIIFEKFTIDGRNYNTVIRTIRGTVESGRSIIKDLKKQEKEIEKGIKKAGKEIKDAEKLALGMSPSKEEKKDNSNVVRNISTLVSTYEQLTSIVMGTAIACAKANLKNSYSILKKVMALTKGVKNEYALLFEEATAEGEVDEILDDDSAAELDSETQADVDDLVSSVEDED